MKLTAPCTPIEFSTKDIYGNSVSLSHYSGKKILLAFFRDAACPFCNVRLYELTNQYNAFQEANVEIIAVFSSTAEEVRRFVARNPRPFILLSDPDLQLYERYGIEHSTTALIKAMLFRLPQMIRGLLKGGKSDIHNPHMKLVPADFLISEQGEVQLAWYGRDTGDHVPMTTLKQFAAGQLSSAESCPTR
ncbi:MULTISPECIES: peroxiredoxin [unclassified Oceanobacter]|uniref:peroxiredoxin family protein n=2 Tax=Gammaproteobacteria TaxID=1236 RepID=UPI0026E496E7|nr:MULTISPECIES: peroxiredoxin-like family protein [unclassified Oceanobacter]MDO6681914.1 peroxiredoxin-like family protein [Oceanobacter sp. 5_MG-2023]MDP2505276.1 peroxiredoxin-like family protein [Oceanobacter sp. 3_MG-2023]MDP2547950.1 peroxiredoxin-like family protein [Oceanobacter sp. 4_MG-2023]MDP2609893.1 peroxiredoxin-like family protein [Oceanobacter sp. 1_MG-2023]MDP2612229.1 peroxiredoxin-like family protein [Oceanobacter sp. 2_MG-2023]